MKKTFSKVIKKIRNFLDYSVFSESLDMVPKGEQVVINTINQYSYCIAEHDEAFKNSLINSDVLLPDGIAIVGAIKLLTGKIVKKIAGWDLHQHLLNDLNESKGSCFYLGASVETLKKIKLRLSIDFPFIKVGNYSPPFKKNFNDADDQKMIDAVNNFKPDVLFVGMTAPKQEKWVNKYRQKLHASTICSIGAVFDFYAGIVQRPNKVLVSFGLEWFGRLIKEPKRMWKRYLYFGPVYIWSIFREKIRTLSTMNNWVVIYPGFLIPSPV